MNWKRVWASAFAGGLMVGASVVTATPANASHWVEVDGLGDGRINSAASDRNNDGFYDQMYTNSNYDGVWDIILYDEDFNRIYEWAFFTGHFAQSWHWDSNGDGASDFIYFDQDRNGRYEAWMLDNDRDRFFEWVALDYSGDGNADTWVYNPPASPSTNSNAREISNIAARQVALTGCIATGSCSFGY